MDCADADLLHAWLDGELDIVTARAVEQHLATCARCSDAAAGARALRAALAGTDLRYAAAPDLAARIRAAVGAPPDTLAAPRDTHDRPPRRSGEPHRNASGREWRWAAAGAAIAAVAVLVVGRTVLPPREAARDRLVDELVASHVRSLMVDHLTDVASSDQHTVRPWFDGKVDFSPPVKDLGGAGFPLLGGRLEYVAGRPVAALVYARRKHAINVFVWPSAATDEVPTAPVARHGYNLIGWTAEGSTYWAVSDLNAAELGDFVRLVREDTAPLAP